MKKLLSFICATCLLCGSTTLLAQGQSNQMFIYGKVTMLDGDTYQGQIRWGKEEAFWFDVFNSSKPENNNLRYLDDDQLKDLNEQENSRWSNRWNSKFVRSWSDNNHTHAFSCQFGELVKLELRSKSRVRVTFKDGSQQEFKGGSNDIGANIQVHDADLGRIKLDWDRIDQVEFMPTPPNFESRFGEPIYGTVYSDGGEFTGYLQWDHDERTTTDQLDGDTRDGDLSIDFGNIRSITNEGRGSDVEFKSGKQLFLFGSNDVDDDNRGIIVNIPGQGRVDIPWEEFDKMVIADELPNTSLGYTDFNNSARISGTVQTKGGQDFKGKIVFDLDEELQLEILNGSSRDVEYLIPFADIKEIRSEDDDSSTIILRNGNKVTLEDSVDVSDRNDGALIFQGNSNNPDYIPWWDIRSIVLD